MNVRQKINFINQFKFKGKKKLLKDLEKIARHQEKIMKWFKNKLKTIK
jgi:hypothetical protein